MGDLCKVMANKTSESKVRPKCKGKSDFDNEIELYFCMPKYDGIYVFDVFAEDESWYLIYYAKAAMCFLTLLALTLLTPVFVIALFARFFRADVDPSASQRIVLAGGDGVKKKLNYLRDRGFTFLLDDMRACSIERTDGILYRITPLSLPRVICGAMNAGLRDIYKIIEVLIVDLHGDLCGEIFKFYCIRLPHKAVYEAFLFETLKNNEIEIVVTASKEDRFAVVQDRLCRTLGIKLRCFPHGLEYSTFLPNGLPGDEFLCLTRDAADDLRQVYKSDKFIFRPDEVELMFQKGVKRQPIDKIVFFPESRGLDVNRKIMTELAEAGITFYVKLPAGADVDLYAPVLTKSMLIHDFEVAISNSICLARKSTVLVEAIYNNSTPYAILIDENDQLIANFIPSLNDSRIRKIKSIDSLYAQLGGC